MLKRHPAFPDTSPVRHGPYVAVAAIALQVLGNLSQASGAKQQAKAQAGAYDYQAQVAANNAKVAQQNATFAGEIGESNAERQEMRTRATVGAIKAGQGASGVDINSGSAADVRASAGELGALDALTIRSNAARQAYGYQTTATSATAQSGLDKYAAENARKGADIGFMGSLLGGAASAGGKALDYNQQGLFSGASSPPSSAGTYAPSQAFYEY